MKRSIIILLMLLLGVAGLQSWSMSKTTRISLGNIVGKNIRNPQITSSGTVRYFTGSAFAELNLMTGKSTNLGQLYRLPNVTDVRWGNEGAVFLASGYSPLDQLYGVLRTSNLATDQPHWWRADFNTNQISLIGAGVAGQATVPDAMWDGAGNAVYYVASPIIPYNAADIETPPATINRVDSTGQETTVANIEAASLLWVGGSRIIYVSRDDPTSVRQYNFREGTDTKFYDKYAGMTVFDRTGNFSIGIESSAKPRVGEESSQVRPIGKLVAADGQLRNQETIADEFSGSIVNNTDNWLAVAETGGEGYISLAGKTKKLSLGGEDITSQHLTAVGIRTSADGPVVYVTDIQNNLYAAGAKDAAASTTSVSSLKAGKLVPDVYRISYDESKGELDIYVYRDTTASAVAALDYLDGRNQDPYQLPIRWYPDNGGPLP